MEMRFLLIFMYVVYMSSITGMGKNTSVSQDMYTLRHLRYSLQIRNFYWPKYAQSPCTSWRGIECNDRGQVRGVNLSGLKRTATGMSDPSFSVDPLRQLRALRYFNASGFRTNGPIPYWLGELSELEVLDLSSCSGIRGSIPDSLGQLRSLRFLSLAGNNLTGDIPYGLGSLVRLVSMNLSSNFMGGRLPYSLTQMPGLVALDVSNNSLVGIELSTSANETNNSLETLWMFNNVINGSLPADIGKLGKLRSLRLSGNRLSGTIPTELGSCRELRELDMSHNSLAGDIPKTVVVSLGRLETLDLSFNMLFGVLPVDMSRLTSIRQVRLSHNDLYGPLPAGIVTLSNITVFDISNNYLNGSVPDSVRAFTIVSGNCFRDSLRQRYRADCKTFYASKGLAFTGDVGLLPTAEPLVGLDRYNSPRRSMHVGALIGGIFGSLGFIAVVGMIVYSLQVHERKKKARGETLSSIGDGRKGGSSGGSMREPNNVIVNLSCIGEAFPYVQIQHATGDFNPANLIKCGHTGELFKGVLDGGLPIVVKRVKVTESAMKRDLLLAELELFSKASHTRLVPLLGHSLERDGEKYLVYKYMQYGDLGQALHRKVLTARSKDVMQSLDWITRLKIAIGVAEGLSYLHHECSPALVHRDLKASSILLDDQFEVRLGSLSEARIQEGGLHPNLIMRFLKRSQTSEQDPDSPVASCAYDVYCFGKILLELVTGKLGIDEPWIETTLPTINGHDKENITKIVDPSLLVDEDLLEEVCALVIIAKMCLNPKPSRRPAIRHILKALENPQRVVRDENFTASLRRSSRSSWNASLFGSWRHSSSEAVEHVQGKHSANSHSLGSLQDQQHHHHNNSSLHRRPGSNEIFPEPF